MPDLPTLDVPMRDVVLAVVFVAAVVAVMILIRKSQGLPIGPRFELWRPGSKEGTRERVREGMVALVVGTALIGAGAFFWGQPVTCGGDVMGPGDRCQTYRDGARVGEPESYSAIKENQQGIGLLIGGLGALIGAQGLWWVVRGRVSRRGQSGDRAQDQSGSEPTNPLR
jgi:hypothetical protein